MKNFRKSKHSFDVKTRGGAYFTRKIICCTLVIALAMPATLPKALKTQKAYADDVSAPVAAVSTVEENLLDTDNTTKDVEKKDKDVKDEKKETTDKDKEQKKQEQTKETEKQNKDNANAKSVNAVPTVNNDPAKVTEMYLNMADHDEEGTNCVYKVFNYVGEGEDKSSYRVAQEKDKTGKIEKWNIEAEKWEEFTGDAPEKVKADSNYVTSPEWQNRFKQDEINAAKEKAKTKSISDKMKDWSSNTATGKAVGYAGKALGFVDKNWDTIAKVGNKAAALVGLDGLDLGNPNIEGWITSVVGPSSDLIEAITECNIIAMVTSSYKIVTGVLKLVRDTPVEQALAVPEYTEPTIDDVNNNINTLRNEMNTQLQDINKKCQQIISYQTFRDYFQKYTETLNEENKISSEVMSNDESLDFGEEHVGKGKISLQNAIDDLYAWDSNKLPKYSGGVSSESDKQQLIDKGEFSNSDIASPYENREYVDVNKAGSNGDEKYRYPVPNDLLSDMITYLNENAVMPWELTTSTDSTKKANTQMMLESGKNIIAQMKSNNCPEKFDDYYTDKAAKKTIFDDAIESNSADDTIEFTPVTYETVIKDGVPVKKETEHEAIKITAKQNAQYNLLLAVAKEAIDINDCAKFIKGNTRFDEQVKGHSSDVELLAAYRLKLIYKYLDKFGLLDNNYHFISDPCAMQNNGFFKNYNNLMRQFSGQDKYSHIPSAGSTGYLCRDMFDTIQTSNRSNGQCRDVFAQSVEDYNAWFSNMMSLYAVGLSHLEKCITYLEEVKLDQEKCESYKDVIPWQDKWNNLNSCLSNLKTLRKNLKNHVSFGASMYYNNGVNRLETNFTGKTAEEFNNALFANCYKQDDSTLTNALLQRGILTYQMNPNISYNKDLWGEMVPVTDTKDPQGKILYYVFANTDTIVYDIGWEKTPKGNMRQLIEEYQDVCVEYNNKVDNQNKVREAALINSKESEDKWAMEYFRTYDKLSDCASYLVHFNSEDDYKKCIKELKDSQESGMMRKWLGNYYKNIYTYGTFNDSMIDYNNNKNSADYKYTRLVLNDEANIDNEWNQSFYGKTKAKEQNDPVFRFSDADTNTSEMVIQGLCNSQNFTIDLNGHDIKNSKGQMPGINVNAHKYNKSQATQKGTEVIIEDSTMDPYNASTCHNASYVKTYDDKDHDKCDYLTVKLENLRFDGKDLGDEKAIDGSDCIVEAQGCSFVNFDEAVRVANYAKGSDTANVFTACKFDNCQNRAIYSENPARLRVEGCEFNNCSGETGGAIYIECVKNERNNGPHISHWIGSYKKGETTVRTTFYNCVATKDHGGAVACKTPYVEFDGCDFIDCRAVKDGGAIWNNPENRGSKTTSDFYNHLTLRTKNCDFVECMAACDKDGKKSKDKAHGDAIWNGRFSCQILLADLNFFMKGTERSESGLPVEKYDKRNYTGYAESEGRAVYCADYNIGAKICPEGALTDKVVNCETSRLGGKINVYGDETNMQTIRKDFLWRLDTIGHDITEPKNWRTKDEFSEFDAAHSQFSLSCNGKGRVLVNAENINIKVRGWGVKSDYNIKTFDNYVVTQYTVMKNNYFANQAGADKDTFHGCVKFPGEASWNDLSKGVINECVIKIK